MVDVEGLCWEVEAAKTPAGWMWRVPDTPIGGDEYDGHDVETMEVALEAARRKAAYLPLRLVIWEGVGGCH